MAHQDNQQVTSEACAWIAKFHGGEPVASDLKLFRAWLAESSANREKVEELAVLWQELNVLTELSVLEPKSKSWLSTIRRFVGGLLPRTRGAQVGYLAGLLIMLSVSLSLVVKQNNQQMLEYATAIGEQRQVVLEDGSKVLLNTNSRIRVSYSPDSRNLYLLQGQAHFDVASNPRRPFKVFAGNGMIRAVGTAFSVYLKDHLLDVTVTEGRVQIKSIASPVELKSKNIVEPEAVTTLAMVNAGQSAGLDQATKAIKSVKTMAEHELDKKLSWHQSLLRFSDQPLKEVVEEVSRYTPVSISISDPALGNLRVGGILKIGETDKLLKALEISFGVKVNYKDDKTIYLSST